MDTSSPRPARSGTDDSTHATDAGADAFVDPARYATLCGQPVMEVYRERRTITCPTCSEITEENR